MNLLLNISFSIPGIPPTGKKLEIPFIAVVNIRGDRLYHEHIAWDQGTVLRQLNLLPDFLPLQGNDLSNGKALEYKLPVTGVDTARKLRDKDAVVSNAMLSYQAREKS